MKKTTSEEKKKVTSHLSVYSFVVCQSVAKALCFSIKFHVDRDKSKIILLTIPLSFFLLRYYTIMIKGFSFNDDLPKNSLGKWYFIIIWLLERCGYLYLRERGQSSYQHYCFGWHTCIEKIEKRLVKFWISNREIFFNNIETSKISSLIPLSNPNFELRAQISNQNKSIETVICD